VKQPWFRKRRFGWGLSPSSWQGWTGTAIYLVLVVLFASAAVKNPAGSIIGVVIGTVLFIIFALATGERPGHRTE
jgi:integral membrane sensor domain MASE1